MTNTPYKLKIEVRSYTREGLRTQLDQVLKRVYARQYYPTSEAAGGGGEGAPSYSLAITDPEQPPLTQDELSRLRKLLGSTPR